MKGIYQIDLTEGVRSKIEGSRENVCLVLLPMHCESS